MILPVRAQTLKSDSPKFKSCLVLFLLESCGPIGVHKPVFPFCGMGAQKLPPNGAELRIN